MQNKIEEIIENDEIVIATSLAVAYSLTMEQAKEEMMAYYKNHPDTNALFIALFENESKMLLKTLTFEQVKLNHQFISQISIHALSRQPIVDSKALYPVENKGVQPLKNEVKYINYRELVKEVLVEAPIPKPQKKPDQNVAPKKRVDVEEPVIQTKSLPEPVVVPQAKKPILTLKKKEPTTQNLIIEEEIVKINIVNSPQALDTTLVAVQQLQPEPAQSKNVPEKKQVTKPAAKGHITNFFAKKT